MKTTACFFVGAAACVGLFMAFATSSRVTSSARAAESGDATRTADEQAIRKLSADFAQALTKGDAKEVAGFWTNQGAYIADDGTVIHGKPAIEKAYGSFLEKNGHATVELTIESIRFLAQDAASVEGDARVRGGRPGRAPSSHYSSLYVRENGEWRLAEVRESPREGPTLSDLDWLIGSWVAKTGGAEVHTTYSWDANKKFIVMHFTVEGGQRNVSGTQRIARDPRRDTLRSWLFGSDGDFGEATWSWDGKHWVVEATGVDGDGSELSAVNIMTPLSNDVFTWQSTKRTSDGVELPDIAPVKVTRVK